MSAYRWKLLGVALMWFAWELVCVCQMRAVADRLVVQACAAVVGIALLSHFCSAWFVDERDMRRRLGLTLAGALGGVVGTAVVLLYG